MKAFKFSFVLRNRENTDVFNTRDENIYKNSLQHSKCSLFTVVTAFFMSTETHAKRFLTVWKRSVSTTFKRSFTVLANQIIVSETFQAFQILTNHISVRKTLSWEPCLVSNVLAFAELANQNPADSIYFTSFFFFFFFFFFFPISLNYNCYKINKNNSQIILWRRVSDAINRKCVLTESDSGRTL